LCHTTNVKCRLDRAPSDPAALATDFYFLTNPLLKKKAECNQPATPLPSSRKINNLALRSNELHNFQPKVNNFFINLPFELAIHMPPSELLDSFEKHIVYTARDVAPLHTRKFPD